MSKNKPDKEYYLLFLLIFILAFAFDVVIGCYVCGSSGATGSATFTLEDNKGDTASSGVNVTFDGRTAETNDDGEVTFNNVGVGTYDVSDINVENYNIKTLDGVNVNSNNPTFTITDGTLQMSQPA